MNAHTNLLIIALISFCAVPSEGCDECSEALRMARRENAVRICAGMFQRMDYLFSKAINSGDPSSIDFRRSWHEIKTNLIVSDFAYSLDENLDPYVLPIRGRYVNDLEETLQLLVRFANVTYSWRPTLPMYSYLKSEANYVDQYGLRELTLTTTVFHLLQERSERAVTKADGGENNIVCREISPGKFRFVEAILRKEFIKVIS